MGLAKIKKYLHPYIFCMMSFYTSFKFRIRQFFYLGREKNLSNIYFHCFYHYGDHIQNMAYLNSLAYSESDKLVIYGVNKQQVDQISEFITSDNLFVVPLEEIPWYSFDLWKNRYCYWMRSEVRNDYYQFFLEFYSYVSYVIGLRNPIFGKIDLLSDVKNQSYSSTEYDILFINSKPASSQFFYSDATLDLIIESLSKKFKVITTKKIIDIESTTDRKMSLYEIGELSMTCKCIVSISTGPSCPALNKENYLNNKPVLIFCSHEMIRFNLSSITSSSLEDVYPFVTRILQ